MKMKEYEVVFFTPKSKAFEWASGLYALIDKLDSGVVNICQINKEGLPEVFEDGSFVVSVTHEDNIKPTRLKMTLKTGS